MHGLLDVTVCICWWVKCMPAIKQCTSSNRSCKHQALSSHCAGELYPTGVRTSAHGISAGTAKVGALWASVWFNYLPSRTKFWTTASFNFGGLLLTALFMPDPVRAYACESRCIPACFQVACTAAHALLLIIIRQDVLICRSVRCAAANPWRVHPLFS